MQPDCVFDQLTDDAGVFWADDSTIHHYEDWPSKRAGSQWQSGFIYNGFSFFGSELSS